MSAYGVMNEYPPNVYGQTSPGSALGLVVKITLLIAVFFFINYVYYRLTHPRLKLKKET